MVIIIDRVYGTLQGLSVVNWTCTYQNGTSASACTNLLAAASMGSSGSLTYSMKNLLAGETYTITVWLEKVEGKSSVRREVQAAVHIAVVPGDPPQVTIKYAGLSLVLTAFKPVLNWANVCS